LVKSTPISPYAGTVWEIKFSHILCTDVFLNSVRRVILINSVRAGVLTVRGF
jgi:hypothetical protein